MRASTSVVSAPGHQLCSLHAFTYLATECVHELRLVFVILKFNHTHLKFAVYGRKQASKHTHTCAQCSHARLAPIKTIKPRDFGIVPW